MQFVMDRQTQKKMPYPIMQILDTYYYSFIHELLIMEIYIMLYMASFFLSPSDYFVTVLVLNCIFVKVGY